MVGIVTCVHILNAHTSLPWSSLLPLLALQQGSTEATATYVFAYLINTLAPLCASVVLGLRLAYANGQAQK